MHGSHPEQGDPLFINELFHLSISFFTDEEHAMDPCSCQQGHNSLLTIKKAPLAKRSFTFLSLKEELCSIRFLCFNDPCPLSLFLLRLSQAQGRPCPQCDRSDRKGSGQSETDILHVLHGCIRIRIDAHPVESL